MLSARISAHLGCILRADDKRLFHREPPPRGRYGVILARLVRHDAGWLAEVDQAQLVRQLGCETRSGVNKGQIDGAMVFTISRNLATAFVMAKLG